MGPAGPGGCGENKTCVYQQTGKRGDPRRLSPSRPSGLAQQLVDDVSVNVGEAEVAALEAES